MLHEALTYRIIQAAYNLHNTIGPGFRERVYSEGMCVELKHQGLAFEVEHWLPLRYRGVEIGDHFADFSVENAVLVELKAVDSLASAHFAQLLNYLRVSRLEVGLLLNFGTDEVQIKRAINTSRGATWAECRSSRRNRLPPAPARPA